MQNSYERKLWDCVEKEAGTTLRDNSVVELPTLNNQRKFCTPVSSLIPSGTVLLGVDPSKNSTGVFLWSEEGAWSEKLPKVETFEEPFAEVKSRRQLSQYIREFLKDKPKLTTVAIEDAFIHSGRMGSARILGALNTALDEVLIDSKWWVDPLEGTYDRVQSTAWKARWIRYSGIQHLNMLSDAKKKVQGVLKAVPWSNEQTCWEYLESLNPDHSGWQDRLDAFACAMSLFLPEVSSPKPTSKGIVVKAHPDLDILVNKICPEPPIESPLRVLSKRQMGVLLSEHPNEVFCTSTPISVGTLCDVPTKWRGQPLYIAFWRKR